MSEKKPLGGRAYGSIPHLPGSRLGSGDHHCHEGQERICTEKARDKHDRVIVTEKLDGACMSVARVGDEIVPLIRAGYRAELSPRPFLRAFGVWVQHRRHFFAEALNDGERLCGEWLISPHGTLYAYSSPFVVFDLVDAHGRRPYDVFCEVADRARLERAACLFDGGPVSVQVALEALGDYGFHGALEQPEGAVWRVERYGKFDFIAKYVRPEKIDGKYWDQHAKDAA